MSRVLTFHDSIVTAIVNSDAYHQSLMNKWESMFYSMYDAVRQCAKDRKEWRALVHM